MSLKITRMDKRHKGTGPFQFYVAAKGRSEFLDWRDWAIESWGNGVERDFVYLRPDVKWGWTSSPDQGLRMYFKSHQELNWFIMRWS